MIRKRTRAVLFDNAYQAIESIQVEIPEGWSVEAFPADSTFTNPAGECTVSWDGRDVNGNEAASGVYFYRLDSGDHSTSRKMLLLK